MLQRFLALLLKLCSRLPLSYLHALGALLGRLTYICSPRFARRLKENLTLSQTAGKGYQLYRETVKKTVAELGKGALELSVAWYRSPQEIANLVKHCDGWHYVEAALAKQHGLVFVSPHLGNYDIAGRYLSHRLPCVLTALYRPPKLKQLEGLMNAGRARAKGQTVPATFAGVKVLLKRLKAGEAVFILPDQVPGQGEGVWAPFFGRLAYTMTLVARLARLERVEVFLCVGERLAYSAGFAVHIEPLAGFVGERQHDAALLNRALETLIHRHPTQYLWSYNRYKCPAGVSPPDGALQ